MNAFLVLSTDAVSTHPSVPPSNVTNVIRDTHKLKDGAILVLCHEFVTSAEVASLFGMNDKEDRAGIVIKIESFAGWETSELWEKLRAWQRSAAN